LKKSGSSSMSRWSVSKRLRLDDGARPRYAAGPMTVTDVEIGHARPARSPDTKAAINYLTASGATAITITEINGVCAFHVGTKMLARSVAIFWIMEVDAKPVVASARKGAGGDAAVAALHRAAFDLRAVLTPNDVAMSRAGQAAGRIEQYIDSMRAKGAMREFTRAYKRRRMEAEANGQGFMTYAVAEARLRRALIPLLVGGQNVGPAASLFAEIFGAERKG